MSSRSVSPVNSPYYKRAIVIAGSANTNGTSQPTAIATKGATLARTGVGTYTLTLTDTYNALLSVTLDLSLATPAVTFPVAGNPVKVTVNSPSGAPVSVWQIPFTIINSSATAVDVAAAAGNSLNWVVVAHDSSTTQG